jgi:Protein of unknown function (DUF1566)
MKPRAALAIMACCAGITSWQDAAAEAHACTDALSSLPSTRFRDNGDGTVSDTVSMLMWMKCPSGQEWRNERCIGKADAYGWADAKAHAAQVSRSATAFFDDWRLPSLRELATITDRGCRNPRTNVDVFPDTPAAPFWSSTARPGEQAGERVLALSFGAEGVLLARKDERLHLRLVRTGP